MTHQNIFTPKLLVIAVSLGLLSLTAQAKDTTNNDTQSNVSNPQDNSNRPTLTATTNTATSITATSESTTVPLDTAVKQALERSDNNSASWYDELKKDSINKSPVNNDTLAELDRQGSISKLMLHNSENPEDKQRIDLAYADESREPDYKFNTFSTVALGKSDVNIDYHGDYDPNGRTDYDENNRSSYDRVSDIITKAKYIGKYEADYLLKKEYNRARPFSVINFDKPEFPYKDNYKNIKGNQSFPSGHTWTGFKTAAIWSSIFPERGQEIFSRALQYGESRVILGKHFPTDTIASRAGNYYYLSKVLEDEDTTKAMVALAKDIRGKAKIDCADGQNLQSCLFDKANPITDAYAKDNDEIGYYGKIYDDTADSQVVRSDLPEVSANLLRLRYPYLTNEQRLDILATTAYPKNSIAAKAVDDNWGLINLPKAYAGPVQINGNLQVNQDSPADLDISGFGQYDEWRNNISGDGKLTKSGAGKLVLTGNNSFAGFNLNAGTLELKGTNTLSKQSTVNNGMLNIASTAVLNSDLVINGGAVNIASEGSINGKNLSLNNAHLNLVTNKSTNTTPSVVNLTGNVVAKDSQINLANGVAGDKLTITGDYTTGGNTWLMDSYLTGLGQSDNLGADGKSYTDNVNIKGNVIDNGIDWVWVNNLNIANPTGKESVLLYDIEGNSNGQFLLQRRVAKGGYEYLLNKHANGKWYLESNSSAGSTDSTTPTTPTTPDESFEAAVKQAQNRSGSMSEPLYKELKQDILNNNPANYETKLVEADRVKFLEYVSSEDNDRVDLAYEQMEQKYPYRFNLFATSVFGDEKEAGDIKLKDDTKNDTNFKKLSDIIDAAHYLTDNSDPKKPKKRQSESFLKEYHHRGRPFQVLDRNKNGEYVDNFQDIKGNSFPSGHTWNGYREAAAWSMIFPERGQEIFSRALQYGESRVFVGAHFPTDTIGARAGNYYYLANLLDDNNTTETFVEMAKKIRSEANVNCADGQTLQSCLLQKQNPITDGYAKNNNEIGYYGIITDPAADSRVEKNELPAMSANLLRLRYPYLTDEQRLETLASTAYPKNTVASKVADQNWGLIDLPKAYTGPARLDSDWTVTQDYNEKRDVAGFGQYDEWRNNISGVGKLTKSGSGKLVLTGNNSFAGFDLNAGTLELKGTNTLSKQSTVNNGMLNIATNAKLNSDLVVTGGEVNILNGGLLESNTSVTNAKINVYSDASIQNKELSIKNGTLNIASGGIVNSQNLLLNNGSLNIAPLSLSANATNTDNDTPAATAPRRLARALTNSNSTVTLTGNIAAKDSQINLANGVAGDKLTITGDYTTGGNTWLMDSYLTGQGQSDNLGADGKSYTDNVKITGNVKNTGVDKVQVNNLNIAEPTGKESILMYDIDGQSDGKFALQGRVAKGSYEYLLNQHTNGNWYLESKEIAADTGNTDNTDNTGNTVAHVPVIRPEVGSYITNASMSNNLFMHRLEDRENASKFADQNYNEVGQLWIRAIGGTQKFDDKSGQINTDGHSYIVHGGIGVASFGNNDEFNVGIMAAYGTSESDSKSTITNYKSSAKINGYGAGLYGTWKQNPNEQTGAYANTWAMWNKFDNKVSGQGFKTVEYDSSGVTASIEAGTTYKLAQSDQGTSYWIQPQGQLVYQNVQQDAFTESTTGTKINKGKANIQTRLGAKAYMNVPTDVSQTSSYRPFIALNWLHNTAANEQAGLDNTYYGTNGNSNLGEVKVGLEGQTSQNSHASVDIAYQKGSDYNNVMGSIGWQFKF